MLEFESITIQNFLSYGDYETTLKLSDLNQCFIRGIVEDNSNDEIDRSNGAGKTNLINAILWCISGRTKQSAKPGSKILHWFSDKDCKITITFKNGATLTRIRKRSGKGETDIIYNVPGLNPIDTTLSVVGNEQKRLERELGFHWDIFCGSMFYGQFGQPWLEIGDQTRKQTIERVLHIDKFASYSEVAKSKTSQLESSQGALKSRIINYQVDLKSQQSHLEHIIRASETWDTQIQNRKRELLTQAATYKQQRDAIVIVDTAKLQAKWDLIAKIKLHIQSLTNKANKLYLEISRTNNDIKDTNRRIKTWTDKDGKICSECEREIPHEHIENAVTPYEQELIRLQARLTLLTAEKSDIDGQIKSVNDKLANSEPDMTVKEAQANNREWERLDNLAKATLKAIENIDTENPNVEGIQVCKDKIDELNQSIEAAQDEIDQIAVLVRHYNYIHKSYSDRRKIKSYVIGKRIPYFNDRLAHYLNEFDLDVRISLSDSLAIESNLWGHEWQSGGERMRSNVAFTLAMFDLHEAIYGRQCNVMVLDEVDGMLDAHGVECLVNIIKNDLSDKVETLFIISHKDSLHDRFPHEVLVTRKGTIEEKNRRSMLTEVR